MRRLPQSLVQPLARRSGVLRWFGDSAAWAFALVVLTLSRYDPSLRPQPHLAVGIATLAAVAALVQLVTGYLTGIYRGAYEVSSFDEVIRLGLSMTAATCALAGGRELLPPVYRLQVDVCLFAGVVAAAIASAARAGWRLGAQRQRRLRRKGAIPLLIFGAGWAGRHILASILSDPACPYLPVGLLDDDPSRRNTRIAGVPLLGPRTSLSAAVARTSAEVLLIAIPSASASLIAEVAAETDRLGLDVKVLPSLSELVGQEDVVTTDIRDVTPADLLGRRPLETDVTSIAGYLQGRRVLVTGAGGSIGSELCRQIAQFSPAQLMMLDRDESALHSLQLTIEGRALLDSPDLLLADIRDRDAVETIFRARQPDVVFHAAALKHLPLLERHPCEAIKTNIHGTLNVLEAARGNGVIKFVNVSTDKAADPVSVLGMSKRLTERLTAHFAHAEGASYLSVRFGNVLGSRGSLLTSLQAQIDAGGPVTITDPRVTRYFMTAHEAVQLVIQAGAIGRPGEVLVLDMGEPVVIHAIAEMLMAGSSCPIEVEYTGLRPGEKLHEQLFGSREHDTRPVHPLIAHVDAPALLPVVARALDVRARSASLVDDLRALCAMETAHWFELDLVSAESRPSPSVPYVDEQEAVTAFADTPVGGARGSRQVEDPV